MVAAMLHRAFPFDDHDDHDDHDDRDDNNTISTAGTRPCFLLFPFQRSLDFCSIVKRTAG